MKTPEELAEEHCVKQEYRTSGGWTGEPGFDYQQLTDAFLAGYEAGSKQATRELTKQLESERERLAESGELSDGYHTFNELYSHRHFLLIAFLREFGGFWVKDHIQDWDLLGTYLWGKQITYHVPSKFRHLYERKLTPVMNENYEFDGHTSGDVLARLQKHLENKE